MAGKVHWPTSSPAPKAVVGHSTSTAYVGVSVEDLEAVAFAHGLLLAEGHTSPALFTLRNRIRMALERTS